MKSVVANFAIAQSDFTYTSDGLRLIITLCRMQMAVITAIATGRQDGRSLVVRIFQKGGNTLDRMMMTIKLVLFGKSTPDLRSNC